MKATKKSFFFWLNPTLSLIYCALLLFPSKTDASLKSDSKFCRAALEASWRALEASQQRLSFEKNLRDFIVREERDLQYWVKRYETQKHKITKPETHALYQEMINLQKAYINRAKEQLLKTIKEKDLVEYSFLLFKRHRNLSRLLKLFQSDSHPKTPNELSLLEQTQKVFTQKVRQDWIEFDSQLEMTFLHTESIQPSKREKSIQFAEALEAITRGQTQQRAYYRDFYTKVLEIKDLSPEERSYYETLRNLFSN